ncbi:uncharacterized protein LOC121726350 isoform X2 [Aricia agestis]|uniref:uncharacterized protein LOC121726350 isoform X2 n=1 Tax=Aricia agestis TaxID=91739 RepID=UPI001C20424D|nr:uncharacterized protein LOC121726350 isoform X2 [Aricia agestis]
MLSNRNLLEIVTIASSCISVVGIFLNYVTDISPITGFWFVSYIVIVIVLSISLSFNCIQWMLQLNKPLKYDIEGTVATYPFLSFLKNVLPQVPEASSVVECKEYDTNELSVISTVLEKKLVSSWYVPYISQEIGFPFACKQMLDQMISKAFKICDKIDSQEIFVDICAVLTSHLKEYRKALKRHEKFPNNSIETLYKKSHPVSITYEKTKKQTSADHCINILRIVMKELVPWELWDTPHSELLVRILAKKLDNFIETELSDPAWLNDKLLMLLTNVEKQSDDKTQDVKEDKPVEQPQELTKEPPEGLKDLASNLTPPPPDVTPPPPVKSSTPEEVKTEVKTEVKIVKDNVPVQTVDDKPVAIMRQKRGRQGRNEVKIYDRIIEGSVKTWETDMDLQCISVGQDLLAGLDDIPLSRLWGHEDTDHSPNVRNVSPQPLWFGEEDTIDLVDLEPQKEMKKESSPKPGDALLKDIQSTVHQAKTKIGDLQDEAAGMMEGLLDKGIAGLKKGLRFTGLSDDPQEKSGNARERRAETVSPELSRARRPEVDGAINIPAREENGNGIHLLVKQHRVTSQDTMGAAPGAVGALPGVVGAGEPSESPEPEYEEAADLSTSIAKLRSLLQEAQAPPREEVWWEGAVETRGRTLHHASSRPLDPAALADEYDMNSERSTSPGQTSNNMQRLDRLFQRTVTGVFNSLKTAVGAEEGEGEGGASPAPRRDWTYVCSAADLGVGAAVSRLVSARAALSHVDAALDSLHMTPPAPPPPPPAHPEDLEEWCATAGARWAALGELLVAGGMLHSHLAFRAATLLVGDAVETLVRGWLRAAASWLRAQVFLYFQQHNDAPPPNRPLPPADIDASARLLAQRIPIPECVCDVEAGVRLALQSVSQAAVTRDVLYRLLDVLAAHYRRSAGRHASLDSS